jgi:hypothetical protein
MKKLITISITIILATCLSFSSAVAEDTRHKNTKRKVVGNERQNHRDINNKQNDSRNHKYAYNKNHHNQDHKYNAHNKRYDGRNHRYQNNKRYTYYKNYNNQNHHKYNKHNNRHDHRSNGHWVGYFIMPGLIFNF